MQTVDQLWTAGKKYAGLTQADQALIQKKWFGSNRPEENDLGKFSRWLILNDHLSEFSLKMLQSGHGDQLRLGEYQIIDQVQRGPQAGSYLALDQVRRRVAIDLLAEDHARQPAKLKAFQQKANESLELDHPNINHVLDTGEAKGFHYLVREADEGELLADILKQRTQLGPIPATKLFAMALAALQTLHDHHLSGGPLGVDSLLLTQASRTGQGSKLKTLKLLNWGFPKELFDPSVLQRRAGLDESSASHSTQLPADWEIVQPAGDIQRLGATLYQSLTGRPPQSPAKPIQRIQEEVPEMLADVVDQMVAADPADRPRNAAMAAKRLRVFLASEEETREVRPEEQLASPTQASPVDSTVPARRNKARDADEAPVNQSKLWQLWEEIQPGQRDWFYFGAGIASIVFLTLLSRLIFGIQFVNLICLLTGGAVSFLVERWLRLRESAEDMTELEPNEEPA